MAAIAITRMVGAGAESIARLLAEELDARYLDRAVITRAASLAGVGEEVVRESQRVPSLLERIAETLGQYPSFEMMMSLPADMIESPPLSLESSRHLVEEVMRHEAQTDTVVVLGHGAPIILRDQPDVLRVFVYGSRNSRIERLMNESKLSRPAVEKQVHALDNEWHDFLRKYYKAEWLNPGLYDVAVNTDRLSIDVAAEIILSAFRTR